MGKELDMEKTLDENGIPIQQGEMQGIENVNGRYIPIILIP
jgi:hypothetical protein